jgi:hypothetical protein
MTSAIEQGSVGTTEMGKTMLGDPGRPSTILGELERLAV